MIQMCRLNWNITWAVALEVTNINFLIAHFATIYENIISLHVWNSLPNCVVDVSTINQFKARLDKFWMHQDVLYDMIEVFKITHNIYDRTVTPDLPLNERANTRGNHYKLQNHTFHYDLRKHFFLHAL